MVRPMKYYVVSRYRFLAVDCQISYIQKQEKFYKWFTPFLTKEEAEKEKKYLEKHSRAIEITIEEIK
jgi:hypothetical protein